MPKSTISWFTPGDLHPVLPSWFSNSTVSPTGSSPKLSPSFLVTPEQRAVSFFVKLHSSQQLIRRFPISSEDKCCGVRGSRESTYITIFHITIVSMQNSPPLINNEKLLAWSNSPGLYLVARERCRYVCARPCAYRWDRVSCRVCVSVSL